MLDYPITRITGVGDAMAKKLAKLNIRSCSDLLFHLPSSYQDRTRITPIRDLINGSEAQIQGVIIKRNILHGRFRRLQIILEDHGLCVTLTYFHFRSAMLNSFAVGTHLRCYGKVRYTKKGYEITHPESAFISKSNPQPLPETLTPIYPLTEGIGQRQIRKLIGAALEDLQDDILPQLLPLDTISLPKVLNDKNWADLPQSLRIIHNPQPEIDTELLLNKQHPAQLRLALEELSAYRLTLLRKKRQKSNLKAPALKRCNAQWLEFRQSLPFQLTPGQDRTIEEIAEDLNSKQPMTRLVQGDVGCGKTLIAAFSILQAVYSGYQAVLMAPTEILAEQHLMQFDKWFKDIRIVPLLGKMTAKAKRINNAEIADGSAQLIIGTHALFQENVEFAKLGLCIIDEQQRFGVQQRFSLHEKGADIHPHQLLMTATPIPRTLAQTFLAHMNLSTIPEVPLGRIPCETILINENRRKEVIERIRVKIKDRQQVYWVCPLIEDSESLDIEAAEKTFETLKSAMPEAHIDLIHGRCGADVKRAVMRDFQTGKTNLLVATTVIEVGIHAPNANFMIIENADRLGLSQLHQLRGRVGRGTEKSYCMMCYKDPLSDIAAKRLQLMQSCTSGFEIAEADMKLRGIGEILGTKQSGMPEFKIANPAVHHSLATAVVQISERLLETPENQQNALIARWLGIKEKYGVI